MIEPLAPLRPGRTRAELESWRDARLHRLVRHAHARVPYYRQLFDAAGLRPDDVRGVADLARVPLTSKADLRAVPGRETVAGGDEPERLIARSTSGSSGSPFVVRRTWLEQNVLHLFRLRAQREIGLRVRDRVARVCILREADRRDNKWIGRTLRAAGLFRTTRIDTFAEPADIASRLRELQADVVRGYPGVLAQVADRVAADGPGSVRPRLVLTGAEALTPLRRVRIEKGLGAPVFDLYGCHEINLVAWQCGETGDLHTCDDAAVVEVVRDGVPVAPGESGEVVVTGLWSWRMPFLRYRLGDVATRGAESCACGRPFATLRELNGRTFEYFRLPGGRSLHPHELGVKLLAEARGWLGQYQLVQEREDHVVLHLVPLCEPRAPDLDAVHAAVGGLLGPEVRLELQITDRILPDPSGKTPLYRALSAASG